MKKSLYLLVITLVCALCSCTSPARKAVIQVVDKIDKSCPIEVEGAGILESVNLDGDCVVYTIDGKISPFCSEEMMKNPEVAADVAAAVLSHSAYKSDMKAFAKAGLSMKVVVKDDDDTTVVDFPADDLKAMAEDMRTDHQLDEDMLSDRLKMKQASLPYDLGKGLKITGISDDGDYIVFDCQVEPELTADAVKANHVDVEEVMYNQLNEVDNLKRYTLERKLRKGMKYNFKDAKGGTYELTYVFGPYEKKHAPAEGKTVKNTFSIDMD